MATVNKDFRVKNGLVVEGATGTINGSNILTTAFDTGDLQEGANLYFTDARAKTSAADLLTNATLTNITITGNGSGITITAENGIADSDTDDLAEGSTNLYFTNARAITAIEGESDLVLSGTLTLAGDPTTNLEAATKQYVDQAESDAVSSANSYTDGRETAITSAYETYADQAEADAVSSANSYTDGRETAITSAYQSYADQAEADAVTTANAYTDTRETAITAAYQSYADQAESDAVATAAADATTKANTAESNANSYTDGEISDLDASLKLYADQAEADAISTASSDATSKANTAESNAKTYTDNLIGDATVDGTGGNTVTDRIATAVANLVDAAPGTLDTLNELAADIGDDENFVTTVTNSIGEKVAKAGDTMTGFLTLHADPTNALHAATKEYVDNSAPTAGFGIDVTGVTVSAIPATIVGAVDTDTLSEGSTNLYFTNQRAVDALEAVVPSFTEVDINSVAKQIAATTNLEDTDQTAVYSFDSNTYRSAKLVVKAAYGTHTEVSEVMITLDTSDNIAITEYAVVSTNGSLIDVTAGMNGTDVEILATAGTANTDVTVTGTLIA